MIRGAAPELRKARPSLHQVGSSGCVVARSCLPAPIAQRRVIGRLDSPGVEGTNPDPAYVTAFVGREVIRANNVTVG